MLWGSLRIREGVWAVVDMEGFGLDTWWGGKKGKGVERSEKNDRERNERENK